jgi:hypothetical protein
MSNEATAGRGTIAATVSPAPLRQILTAASEQGVPNPRAGPQPPQGRQLRRLRNRIERIQGPAQAGLLIPMRQRRLWRFRTEAFR